MVKTFIFFCFITVVNGCRSGSAPAQSDQGTNPRSTEKNSQELQSWATWKDEYDKARELENQQNDGNMLTNEEDQGPKSGWLDEWRNLGPGYGGAAPPPWAYTPIDKGLPAYCYYSLSKGPCNEKLTRWAFDAYTGNCKKFIYSGCRGNQNNFTNETKCESSCMFKPISGCSPDTEQTIESEGDDK